jgi:hypothetical protein
VCGRTACTDRCGGGRNLALSRRCRANAGASRRPYSEPTLEPVRQDSSFAEKHESPCAPARRPERAPRRPRWRRPLTSATRQSHVSPPHSRNSSRRRRALPVSRTARSPSVLEVVLGARNADVFDDAAEEDGWVPQRTRTVWSPSTSSMRPNSPRPSPRWRKLTEISHARTTRAGTGPADRGLVVGEHGTVLVDPAAEVRGAAAHDDVRLAVAPAVERAAIGEALGRRAAPVPREVLPVVELQGDAEVVGRERRVFGKSRRERVEPPGPAQPEPWTSAAPAPAGARCRQPRGRGSSALPSGSATRR